MASATLSGTDTHIKTLSTSQLKTNLSKSIANTTANTIFPKKEAIDQNTINKHKHIVDELIKNDSFTSINEHQIPIRRLVNHAKRFIISNAHLIIPHEIINEYLLLEGIKILSQITFLKSVFTITWHTSVAFVTLLMYLDQ
jgi:hypothetical protein